VFVAGGVATAALTLGCVSTASADWLGNERQLTSGSAFQEWPQLSGTRLAYADHRAERIVADGGDIATLFDIRVLDLKTGTDLNLTPQHTALGRPAISGNAVVWTDFGTGTDRGLHYYDLATGRQRRLDASPGTGVQLSGVRLCYQFQGRIHVYNLSSGRDLTVSPSGSSASACDISGQRVVWQGRRDGSDSDIYAYDLATRRETRLTTATTDQSLPRVDHDLVVWQDEVSATNTDIFAANLATGTQTRVTDDESKQWFADVADGRIVWMDERDGHGNTEIYVQDAASGVTTRVTQHEGWSGNPTVAGDQIAYEDSRGDSHSIFLRRVTPPQISVLQAPGSERGTAELTGHLIGADAQPVTDETVVLESSSDGGPWVPIDSAVTGQRGVFSFVVDARSESALRVRFAGSPEYPGATSPDIAVDRVAFVAGLRGPLP
jgi:beta propeller repeat protein